MKIKEAIEQIADYYGLESQSRQCGEECAELIVALSKLRRDDTGIACVIYNITEEIADVAIMIAQIQYLLGISDEEVEDIMKEKLEERIDKINLGESLRNRPKERAAGNEYDRKRIRLE